MRASSARRCCRIPQHGSARPSMTIFGAAIDDHILVDGPQNAVGAQLTTPRPCSQRTAGRGAGPSHAPLPPAILIPHRQSHHHRRTCCPPPALVAFLLAPPREHRGPFRSPCQRVMLSGVKTWAYHACKCNVSACVHAHWHPGGAATYAPRNRRGGDPSFLPPDSRNRFLSSSRRQTPKSSAIK